MTIHAKVISLNTDNPVAIELVNELNSGDIQAELVSAIDGRRQMPALESDEKLNQKSSLINRKSELTATEVGCYLSHYRIIKNAYQQGLKHICIFEDDVVAEPKLNQVIETICKLDEQKHMVRLMSLKLRKRKFIESLSSEHSLARPLRGALGTQGYILNREGMNRVIKAGANICMPIDKFYDSFFLFGLNCYYVEPHVIYEQDSNSTVAKRYQDPDKRLWVKLAWRINKLYRSLMRKWHYVINYSEYSGAEEPSGNIGKSGRIR